MYKVTSVVFLLCACLSLMALQNKKDTYEFTQKSENDIYQGTLACETRLTTTSFQDCHFRLSKQGKALTTSKIFITGGMPAHQHGLPTAPKIVWSKGEKTYLIKGLKFSMPGEWLLNFNINAENADAKDTISMTINVN